MYVYLTDDEKSHSLINVTQIQVMTMIINAL